MNNHDTPDELSRRDEAAWNADYDRRSNGAAATATVAKPKRRVCHGALEMLLAVARRLRCFSLHELAIECWRTAPHLFGLPGAEQLSASDRRVYAVLAGKRGVIARGLITRKGNVYFFTEGNHAEEAAAVSAGADTGSGRIVGDTRGA